jgi:hypothetical protein
VEFDERRLQLGEDCPDPQPLRDALQVMERVFQPIMGGGDLIQQLRGFLAAGWGPASPALQPLDLINQGLLRCGNKQVWLIIHRSSP